MQVVGVIDVASDGGMTTPDKVGQRILAQNLGVSAKELVRKYRGDYFRIEFDQEGTETNEK